MNTFKNVFCAAGFVAAAVVGFTIKRCADHDAYSSSSDMAEKNRPEEEKNGFESATKDISMAEEAFKREKNALSSSVSEYKESIKYGAKMSDIRREEKEAIGAFKNSIDYDAKKSQYEIEAKERLKAFKDSINYDTEKQALEKAIKDAERKYDKQRGLYDSADSSIMEEASKLKHAAENTKNEIVSDSKEKLKELEDKVEAEKKSIESELALKMKAINDQLSSEKARIAVETKKKLSKLDESVSKYREKAKSDIEKSRTFAEDEAIANYEANKKIVEGQSEKDCARTDEIYSSLSTSDRLAMYFRNRKWSKGGVIFIASTPLVFAGALAYDYVKLVINTLKKM